MTALLFDLDGTLLDTLQDLLDATNYALGVHGYPSRTLRELRSFVGNGARNQITCAVPRGGDVDGVLKTYQEYYPTHCRIRTSPYDGIPDALEALGKRYQIAIVSNKPDRAVKPLCAHFFPGIYALGEAPDCPRKPAPDMVYKAMEALDCSSCIYIGDSEVDILTAKNAGVPCIAVTWGFRDRAQLLEAGAERLADTPAELVQILSRLRELE